MAYKRGDPLIERGPVFRAASAAVSWPVGILGRVLIGALYGYRVMGREHLAAIKGGRAVFVSNHVLPLDPLFYACAILPRRTYFTLLEETVLTPGLGTLVRLLGGIPIPPDPERLPAVDEAMKTALETRGLVHFYPEGECFLFNQELKEFKAGAFYYAIKHQAAIVPLVTVLKPGSLVRGGALGGARVELQILPAITPPEASGRAARDLHEALALARSVRGSIQACIDEAGGDKSLYRGPMPRIRGVNDREREG
jgi:1-acyl-sn-glycerol-3-phosphate acyltransferase